MKIEYISGKKNVVADTLSRNVDVSKDDNTLTTQIKSVVMNIQCDKTWLAKHKEEDWLKEIFQKPENECNSALKEQDMFVKDGMLYKSSNGRKALVVPQDETKTVFDSFHNGIFGGHACWFKTFQMMQKYVFWPGMRSSVRKWVKKCFTCARYKTQQKAIPPLKPILSSRPYELVGIDVFSISQTSPGVQHVVTVIDHHSKFCAAYAVANKSAETIAKVFWENWCLREGRMCTTLLSDKGGEFLNEIMQEIQKLTGVEQKFTVGHNPRENGVTERMNETLKGLLSKMSDGVSEWDQRLAYALFFYNSSPRSTTGESLFFLLHGADPNFPICGNSTTVVSPYTVDLYGYKVELARGMKALHEVATERMQKQAEAMKRYYDKLHQVEKTRFELYDRVFVFNPNVSVDRDSTNKEIGGSLTDYEQGCGEHRFKLQVMPVQPPPTSTFWSATTPLELARGAAVAEAVTMDEVAKEQFYMGTSPAVLEFRLAEPTDEQIIMAMLKMMDECPERKAAFQEAMRAPFKCSAATTANTKKAARKIRIAERVRAALDGGKALQVNGTIIVGDRNGTRFAAALGLTTKHAPSLAELRAFLSSHFASSVKRVFIWLDLPSDKVLAEVFIQTFIEELKAAAAWEHVVFVILPPPYTELRLPSFDAFMSQFNKASPQLKNVLWLDDNIRWDGYRFSRTLGANEFVLDGSSVYPEGTISSKGADAAIKLLKKLCGWLIIEKQDAGDHRQDNSNEESLHVVRGGKVTMHPARGAPSRGGGGGAPQRGRGTFQERGRGNQSNFGEHRRGFN